MDREIGMYVGRNNRYEEIDRATEQPNLMKHYIYNYIYILYDLHYKVLHIHMINILNVYLYNIKSEIYIHEYIHRYIHTCIFTHTCLT